MTDETAVEADDFLRILSRLERPMATSEELAARLETTVEAVESGLGDEVSVSAREIGDVTVWYPSAWTDRRDRERVIVFPDTRELVVDQPTQFTRAQLAQLATLEATTGAGGYRYRIRDVDIWHAPYDDLEALRSTLRDVLSSPEPSLEEWVADQWNRARQFTLDSHPDGYTVLTAATPNLMATVARQELDSGQLRGPISETESWVAEGSEAAIKSTLYEAGFPVADRRELESGDPLDLAVEVSLRDYQTEWVDSFMGTGAGVLVGPPGSGKTVAALEIMARVGGETLILVPGRELAGQWRHRILSDTDLEPADVGEFHGGVKERRPVTIATYHIAGMDRHHSLFDDRQWGLIVFDEVHHIPADVYRRAASLQSRHRLGLSASPVRGDDKESEIFTLVGPPIGTDWAALLDAGYVVEPELEVRYLPWGDAEASAAYAAAEGHERRQQAALNPAKQAEVRRLRNQHDSERVLVFVDWLEQGEALAELLGVPFVSGETPHAHRERYFADFRTGDLDTLVVSRVGDEGIDLPDASVAILASGLGGSRRQGTQRVGRTMRPVGGAQVYVLATQGTTEADFATKQLRHLQGKGLSVTETTVDAAEIATPAE